MLPGILGVSVPDAYLAGAPPVNKLTVLKSNKDLWEGDQGKRTGTENCVVEEKMTYNPARKQNESKEEKNSQRKVREWTFNLKLTLQTVKRMKEKL